MSIIKRIAVVMALSLASLGVCFAQQTPIKPSYTKAYGDWNVECYTTAQSKECQIYSLSSVANPQKQFDSKAPDKLPILRTSVTLFNNQPVMIFTTPLAVQLSEGLKLRLNTNNDQGKIFINVKDKDGKNVSTDITQINFERCLNNGCIAVLPLDVDVSNQLLDKLKKASKLFVNFSFDAAQKDKTINAEVSLKGFSGAYTDLLKQSSKK